LVGKLLSLVKKMSSQQQEQQDDSWKTTPFIIDEKLEDCGKIKTFLKLQNRIL
jgi:hypothetical protein